MKAVVESRLPASLSGEIRGTCRAQFVIENREILSLLIVHRRASEASVRRQTAHINPKGDRVAWHVQSGVRGFAPE